MVGVAQLVERRTVAPNVVGSNPISHPKPCLGSCPPLKTEVVLNEDLTVPFIMER